MRKGTPVNVTAGSARFAALALLTTALLPALPGTAAVADGTAAAGFLYVSNSSCSAGTPGYSGSHTASRMRFGHLSRATGTGRSSEGGTGGLATTQSRAWNGPTAAQSCSTAMRA